ncbi:hypothetical protein AAHE18_10G134600 [Arachis hypogaea]
MCSNPDVSSPAPAPAPAPGDGPSTTHLRPRSQLQSGSGSGSGGACSGTGEVQIRIIGTGDQDNNDVIGSVSSSSQLSRVSRSGHHECIMVNGRPWPPPNITDPETRHRLIQDPPVYETPASEVYELLGSGNRNVQQAVKWLEQLIPFSLLLLVVFIRQHLQGFFLTIYVSAVLLKSNEVVKEQTALKGDRKVSVLVGISVAFMLHVIAVYWFQNDDLLYPIAMLPPKETPLFWHAIFTVLINDTLVRQAAMAFKLLVLIFYKCRRGPSFRRQGQILTAVEYVLLLYRALLPTPVWYRFFLNHDYGSLFSSLTTGLYLTFKLTTLVEKIQNFFSALRLLSGRKVQYGVYATKEQVKSAGDMCAICQEKMRAPLLLHCKHLFCEECVSEWLERERTCPLCRANVKSADLLTYGDGSTSILCQLF